MTRTVEVNDRRARIEGHVIIDEGGIIAQALDRIAELERRVAALEGARLSPRRDDFEVPTTPTGRTDRVLEFLDTHAPTRFTAAVIASNLGEHRSDVASSLEGLERRGVIHVIRGRGALNLFHSSRIDSNGLYPR